MKNINIPYYKEIASQSLAMMVGARLAYKRYYRNCEERSNLFNNQLSAIS